MTEPALRCPSCASLLAEGRTTCPACHRDVTSLLSTQSPGAAAAEDDGTPGAIGEFRVLRVIGRGGMGTVYEAYQDSMRRRVALKILEEGLAPPRDGVSRFEREAWIGGRLSHPNIVKVYGQGTEGRTRYIAMELVQGKSLHAVIREAGAERREGAGSESSRRQAHIRRMVELFVGVVEALAHVHAQGIVHRDIKPLNLLLSGDGSRLLLTDFGLARDEEASRVTRRGDFLGTIRYMSPEQLLAQRARVDHRSDIWSLGVSLYEAVTLELPFSGDSEEAYISAVSTKEPLPARARSRTTPRDLETILMKCLARDPERRYASAEDLKDDLRRYLEGRPIRARRPGLIYRGVRLAGRNRAALAVLASAAAVIALLLLLWPQTTRRAEQMERLRATLETVIETGSPPESILESWDELGRHLAKELARNPRGELTLLTGLASSQLEIFLPPVSLLSEPVVVEFSTPHNILGLDHPTLQRINERFPYILDIEISWDGGEARRVITHTDRGGGGTAWTADLRDLLDGNRLTPGPHRLDVTTRFSFLDPETLSEEDDERLRFHEVRGGMDSQWLPDAQRPEALLHTARRLDPLNIHLYETYPEDFPRAIHWDLSRSPVDSWFSIEKVVFLRVELREAGEPGQAVRWDIPLQYGRLGSRLTKAPMESNEFFGAILLQGTLAREIPVPIAANGTLRIDPETLQFPAFPIALGTRGFLGPGENSAQWDKEGRLSAFLFRDQLPALRQEIPPDGSWRGRLELAPSRTVAREAKWLDRYLGEPLSFPVEIEVRTVPGEWTVPPSPAEE